MSKYTRSAHVIWKGNFSHGRGLITSESKAIKQTRYTFNQRTTDANQDTNPEELLAATAAACFAMALSKTIEEEDAIPTEINVDADVTLDVNADPKITELTLRIEALVSDFNEERLRESVEKTVDSCPVVQLLKPGLNSFNTKTHMLKRAS